MNIWLWVVVFLTWCAFVYVWTSISQFRTLLMKNDMLARNLRHTKKRLVRTENALMSAETYITEQYEALNQWSEAYDYQSDELDRALDLMEQWYALDVKRRLFNSFEEVDDLLLQKTTKEFIKLMAYKRATEEKAKQRVVSLDSQKNIQHVVDDISDTYKKIKSFYSDEGHEDIERLIEQEKLKFL